MPSHKNQHKIYDQNQNLLKSQDRNAKNTEKNQFPLIYPPNLVISQDLTQEYVKSPLKITDFYENKTILITGSTGFLGKVLLEKLLRKCENLREILLILREKRGVSTELRLKELIKNPIFDNLRENSPKVFDKIRLIEGDVAANGLKLTKSNENYILENVEIVFHSAATVRFNEELKNALIMNTLGTKRILELCERMKKLQSFVHVSTAFSNSDKKLIKEAVYEPNYDIDSIINCVENFPKEILDVITKKLLEKHPNTYTFTKLLAEYLVYQFSSKIPVAIVRPSIITAAWQDPIPGWCDNVSGITGIFMECGRGTIKSIICDETLKMDLIPVDMVVNCLISTAWHTVIYPTNQMRVYNCVSGSNKPITWRQFADLTQKYSKLYPSKYVQWYPGFKYTTNEFLHEIIVLLYHKIPSSILDVVLYLTRQKPIMLKISQKFNQALHAGKFFSLNEFNFETKTIENLAKEVEVTGNADDFPLDFNDVDFQWEEYVKNFMLGVRKYVLKDDITSLSAARTKLNRLYWFQKCSQVVSVYIIVKLFVNKFLVR